MLLKIYALAVLITAVLLLPLVSPAFDAPLTNIAYLESGASLDIAENVYAAKTLLTFCYAGKPKSLKSLFETVELWLSIPNDDYTEYGGATPAEVLQNYNRRHSLFSMTLEPQKRQRILLSPFEQECIGVATTQAYKVGLHHSQLDVLRLLSFAAGLYILWWADCLAKNKFFYYVVGTLIDIFSLFPVFIAIAIKWMPQRPKISSVLISVLFIAICILSKLICAHYNYVMWYMPIAGLISFLACRRIGLPKTPYPQRLSKWMLQAVGCGLIFVSTSHKSAAFLIMAINICIYYYPSSIARYFKMIYHRHFPPKRRFLTEEEYQQQTLIETERSLKELRNYVNSPDCKKWQIISRLRNPTHFARFANGELHLYEQNINEYTHVIEEDMDRSDEENEQIPGNRFRRFKAARTQYMREL